MRSASDARSPAGSRDDGVDAGLLSSAVVKAVLVLVTVIGVVVATRDADPSPPPPDRPRADASASSAPRTAVVRIANGKGVPGAASEASEALRTAGWTTEDPVNGPRTEFSIVYFTEGHEADARSVAQLLSISRFEMVSDSPPTEIAGVQVLVVLGTQA